MVVPLWVATADPAPELNKTISRLLSFHIATSCSYEVASSVVVEFAGETDPSGLCHAAPSEAIGCCRIVLVLSVQHALPFGQMLRERRLALGRRRRKRAKFRSPKSKEFSPNRARHVLMRR